jgi:hypothetical protein
MHPSQSASVGRMAGSPAHHLSDQITGMGLTPRHQNRHPQRCLFPLTTGTTLHTCKTWTRNQILWFHKFGMMTHKLATCDVARERKEE